MCLMLYTIYLVRGHVCEAKGPMPHLMRAHATSLGSVSPEGRGVHGLSHSRPSLGGAWALNWVQLINGLGQWQKAQIYHQLSVDCPKNINIYEKVTEKPSSARLKLSWAWVYLGLAWLGLADEYPSLRGGVGQLICRTSTPIGIF